MSKESSLLVVDVDPQSQEYGNVLTQFEKTMRKTVPPAATGPLPAATRSISHSNYYNSIVKIQRIQNLVLYGQYIAKRTQMDKNNPSGHRNEHMLFHGTSADTCGKINQQGFNRSFSGKNGT